MENVLETLSKKDLIALLNQERKEKDEAIQKISKLQFQLAQLTRMVFGQKRERFEGDKNQLSLPFEMAPEQAQEQEDEAKEKLSYERRKRKSAHKGRNSLPDHLEVREIVIEPEMDTTDLVRIGEEITDELEYEPASFYIKRYIRPKYAPKNKEEGIVVAELPSRVIEKGIPGPALLANLLVWKYVDHLPLYRLRQAFLRDKIPIANSTLVGWVRQTVNIIDIIYQNLIRDTKAKGYLQADETGIKVLDKDKKGSAHRGYYWVYHSPIDGTVLFDYQPTRSNEAANHVLKDFQGYLQSDGYSAYDKIGKREGVIHLNCWAHARREFEKSIDNDRQRSETALLYIQKLYAVERKAREGNLNPTERKELRLNESLPIIQEFGEWMLEQLKDRNVLPKSPIGKAFNYSLKRWNNLSAYLYDGILEIDNNLAENTIRPIALGRKNYLFAGSHDAASRAACIYSMFAMCKIHKVNPYEWLKYTLENVLDTNHKEIRKFYPQNYKKMMEEQEAL